MITSPKKAFYVGVGLLTIILLAGAGLFYTFDSELTALNTDIGKQLADQEVLNSQIKIYRATEETVNELGFVSELAENVLPSSKEQGKVVAEIKKFITDQKLTFESVAFTGANIASAPAGNTQTQAQAGLTGVRILPTTAVIQAGASYEQIIRLLETIENNQRKMQITQISLTPDSESNGFSTITMQIDVYLRSDTPAPVEGTEGEQ